MASSCPREEPTPRVAVLIASKAFARIESMMRQVADRMMGQEPARSGTDPACSGSGEPIVARAERPRNAVPGLSDGGSLLAATIRQLLGRASPAADAQLTFVLARMVDAIHEGLVVCDRAGIIVYSNAHLSRMLGVTEDQLLHHPAAARMPGIFEPIAAARTRGERECRFDATWLDGTGGVRTLHVHAAMVHGADDNFHGFYGVVQDLSGRSKAEAELHRSERESTLLAARLLSAQEEERRRIARQLQEDIGQTLGELKFGLEAFAELARLGEQQAASGMGRLLIGKLQAAVQEVRRISMNLHPSTLDDLGVLATIGWFTREFQQANDHVDLQTSVEVCEEEVPAKAKVAIYRTVQEALNNVLMHADARSVTLNLRSEAGSIELSVQDDGVGFDPSTLKDAVDSGERLGLAIMRERATASGGRLFVDSAPGRGTIVRATWPSDCPRTEPSR